MNHDGVTAGNILILFCCGSSLVPLRSLQGERPPQRLPPAGGRCPAAVLANRGPRVPGGPRLCGAFCAGRITQTHILRLAQTDPS